MASSLPASCACPTAPMPASTTTSFAASTRQRTCSCATLFRWQRTSMSEGCWRTAGWAALSRLPISRMKTWSSPSSRR
eukprot:7184940-Alexandrium_andersonii.AAC.1